jgi:hypothetical protein
MSVLSMHEQDIVISLPYSIRQEYLYITNPYVDTKLAECVAGVVENPHLLPHHIFTRIYTRFELALSTSQNRPRS